jgi:antitoxin (DNA-binding transcriptional repressor) of toxin-antitoxin stability system
MRIINVAQARADLAGLLARNEIVVIARYGRPVGLLLGMPPSALLDDVQNLSDGELWSRLEDAYRFTPSDGRDRHAKKHVKNQRRKPR